MNASDEVVTGTLRDDGTVVLDEKPEMPPGRVRVTIEAGQTGAEILAVLRGIRERRKACGTRARSADEASAVIRQLRDESEERLRRLEEIRSRPGRNQC
jgi:hypothetical protein